MENDSTPKYLRYEQVRQLAETEGISFREARSLIKWRSQNARQKQRINDWESRRDANDAREAERNRNKKIQQNKLRETLGLPQLP